ncbi:hypothetical protein B566_EDAN006205, partial [Ephemera danica]
MTLNYMKMIHCNLSVVIILVLLNYINCSVPEARVKCEENANNYDFFRSSNFTFQITQFHQSPTDDTIFCYIKHIDPVFDLTAAVYLKLPILEDRPYIGTIRPETNGSCLESRRVSITKTFKENPGFDPDGIEFIAMTYQFKKNARFDFVGLHSEDCD